MERIRVDDIITLKKADLKGKIICFPTDTVYGLGTLYGDQKALKKIYNIKHRSHDKPLANLCSNLNQIEALGINISALARNLMNQHWPGPLTIILQSNNEKISFRMPDCLPALKIINHFGLIPTTSVNESGEPELNSYQEIKDRFGTAIDYYIIDHWCFSGISSTVVDLSKNEIEIIRQGSLKL